MVLHNRTGGDNNGFGGLNPSTGEIRRMEVVEPSSNFFRRGVGKKEANLAFDMLPTLISI